MKTIKITITETACNAPSKIYESSIFNVDTINCKDIEEAKIKLIERYGKFNTKTLRKIYRDTEKSSVEVGYLKSFWNKDYSHNSKNWYQTDWIEINEVTYNSIMINN